MNILGYEYTVNLESDQRGLGGHVGLCYTGTQQILLAYDQPIDSLYSTVIHEVLEALNYHLELKLRHQQISSIEVGIFNTLYNAKVDLTPLLEGAKLREEKKEEKEDANTGQIRV